MVGTQKTEEALLLRVAENIKERRRALGLTQAQLAERLGVDTETLSRFERGKHSPTLKNLARLAGLLQTTISDLLAEERQQPSDDAIIMTAWLDALSPDDRAFALAMLKQYCDYLGARKANATLAPVSSEPTVTFTDVARAIVCPVESLEGCLDNVMSLIDHGLRVELVSGSRREYVTKASVATLFKVVPAVRNRVVARFPASAEVEVKPQRIKPKKLIRTPFSERPSLDKKEHAEREAALPMTSETADGRIVSLREDDEPAISRRVGLPTKKDLFRVEMVVDAAQLHEKLGDVLKVLDGKRAVRVERDGKPLGRVDLATVYKLYRYAPELREPIVARYPECVAREKADQKQEAKDLRSYQPKPARTVTVKKERKAVPESWVATQEVAPGFSDEGGTEPSQGE